MKSECSRSVSISAYLWSVLLGGLHFDKVGDAGEVADALGGRLDRGGGAAVEAGVKLVRPLRPDLAAPALRELLEVRAARVERLADRLVLHEQTLERLAGRVAIDVLTDS